MIDNMISFLGVCIHFSCVFEKIWNAILCWI